MNKGCETGPTAYSPYPRRLESLTFCWCYYKGSTFYSVILRPWVLVRPESHSRPPAWQLNQLSHRCARWWTVAASGCKTGKCCCRNVGLPCTGACNCRSTKEVCCQNAANDDAVENEGQWMLQYFKFFYFILLISFSIFLKIGLFKQLIWILVSASIGRIWNIKSVVLLLLSVSEDANIVNISIVCYLKDFHCPQIVFRMFRRGSKLRHLTRIFHGF